MAGILVFGTVAVAQESGNANLMKVAAGQKLKVSGLIVEKGSDGFILRENHGMDVQVKLSGATSIKEKKSNPFRGALTYSADQLVRGLSVEVEGLGDTDGSLAARDIRFTQTQYAIANSVESRVTPVEARLAETGNRLTRAEENAQHLSGQVQELNAISNAARTGAKAAQETADQAMAGVGAANERITDVDQTTNSRITAVDDYEVKESLSVQFKLGSSVLSADAREKLDQLARTTLSQRGYVVEITGYASADGDADFNRKLSQQRADAVVQYLADNLIPLRRIVTPYGFGVNMPVADNATREGREKNRRVEVKVLISKGLGVPAASAPASIVRNR
jgi:outer membrane protein OmpA-like peptidoglycan-associated protein